MDLKQHHKLTVCWLKTSQAKCIQMSVLDLNDYSHRTDKKKDKDMQRKNGCHTAKCRTFSHRTLHEPKSQKRESIKMSYVDMKWCQSSRYQSSQEKNTKNEVGVWSTMMKRDKGNKMIIHFRKISLEKTAQWAGEWVICCGDMNKKKTNHSY